MAGLALHGALLHAFCKASSKAKLHSPLFAIVPHGAPRF
jgi:hypothetical protein